MLRFENLSDDPSLDWVGRALSESLSVSLDGALDGPVVPPSALGRAAVLLGTRPASAPGVSSEVPQALVASANHVITGYVERVASQVRIAAVVTDLSTGWTRQRFYATAPTAYEAMIRLAIQLSPHAKPPITASPDALRTYAAAFDAEPQTAVSMLKQAAQQDPHFGAPWVALTSFEMARGDRPAAAETIEASRSSKLDALSTARLDLAEANLKNDRLSEVAAMRRIASLNPADTTMLRSLAELETATGDLAAATRDWKKIIDTFPADGIAWNALGYVRSYAGDYAGALAALQQYGRLRPKDPNPLDSIGDLNYSFRRFKEAARNYQDAYTRQPGFEQGGDLYKAAWAKYYAGDKQGADLLFAQFRDQRQESSGHIANLVAADWLYRTGRQHAAVEALRQLVATEAGPLQTEGWAQLTVWDLIAGDRPLAAKDAANIGNTGLSPALFIARFAALPSATPSEWEARADRMLPPNLSALRQLALAYALVLDNKREASLPVWEKLVQATSTTDFFVRAVETRLLGKTLDRALVPEPGNLNQFAGLLDKL